MENNRIKIFEKKKKRVLHARCRRNSAIAAAAKKKKTLQIRFNRRYLYNFVDTFENAHTPSAIFEDVIFARLSICLCAYIYYKRAYL